MDREEIRYPGIAEPTLDESPEHDEKDEEDTDGKLTCCGYQMVMFFLGFFTASITNMVALLTPCCSTACNCRAKAGVLGVRCRPQHELERPFWWANLVMTLLVLIPLLVSAIINSLINQGIQIAVKAAYDWIVEWWDGIQEAGAPMGAPVMSPDAAFEGFLLNQ